MHIRWKVYRRYTKLGDKIRIALVTKYKVIILSTTDLTEF